VNVGEELELTAQNAVYGGDCIARSAEGMVVFVPCMAPGDRARVRVTHVRKNWAKGKILEIISPGPDRIEAPCPFFGDCGGCQWQHISLDGQRRAKEEIVKALFRPLGLDSKVSSIRGGAGGCGYRNRLILPVRAGEDGKPRFGFYRASTHDIVEMDSCLVQNPALWTVARSVIELAREYGWSGYDENSGVGMLRHILVRHSPATMESGVVLVTAGVSLPSGKRAAARLMEKSRNVVAVMQNVNARRTNVILGEKTVLLGGLPYMNEKCGGLRLRTAPAAFFQANPGVTEIMLGILREWAWDERGGILDLYCGGGLLGLAAARNAAWLVGIEEERRAVSDARANAKSNSRIKTAFYAGPVGKILPKMASRLGGLGTVIADPPRKGLAPAVLRAISGLPARRLLYISCDPSTLARDLKSLVSCGYSLEEAVPLDMFPQTYHIEVMARLTR